MLPTEHVSCNNFWSDKNEYKKLQIFKKTNSVKVSLAEKQDQLYVIKRIVTCNLFDEETVNIEANIGLDLNHKNFAKTIQHYDDGKGKHYLIIEHVTNGKEFRDFIKDFSVKQKISVRDFKYIACQIFDSIVYCLNINVYPGDINPGNVLIDFDHKVTFIDFGKYKYIDQSLCDYIVLSIQVAKYIVVLLKVTCFDERLSTWEKLINAGPSTNEYSKEALAEFYTKFSLELQSETHTDLNAKQVPLPRALSSSV